MDLSKGAPVTGDEHGSSGIEINVASGAAVPSACSLRFRGTLFGSTLAKVFSAVDRVRVGEIVSITTNDPWAVKDIPVWVRWNGQGLEGMIAEADVGWFTYLIRKNKPFGARFALYRLSLRLTGKIGQIVSLVVSKSLKMLKRPRGAPPQFGSK